ncbi:SAYSvFN domain-containing protein 1 isoform X1 [Notamacropus eugenii]|uniref:SAYSvFN domain-containing protein 1 isoform X1 n=1 Tax=Notamacropus eugenii TaxID=9315 RepID=UPI003B67AA42
MEQRLAAFRASRKRAELEGGPSSSGRSGKAPGEDVAAPPPSSQAPEAPGGRAKLVYHLLSLCLCIIFHPWSACPSELFLPDTAQETFQTQGSLLQNPAAVSPSRWDQSFLPNVTFLKVALWLVLLGLFVELEFGLVYFVLSLFYWMYVGTRGPGEKKEGEKSAYSVFNPGCESIQGTLTAEQFERELQFHPMAGR